MLRSSWARRWYNSSWRRRCAGKVRRSTAMHLAGSVLRATWGPLLIVPFLSAITGFFVQGKCPSAVTLIDAIRDGGRTK
jgi:hypothetical protein